MTIRRHVDLAAINTDYTAFLEAAEKAASDENTEHLIAVKLMELIGDTVDDLLRNARMVGIQTCPGDGIREAEIVIFDMLRSKNPQTIADVIAAYAQSETPTADDELVEALQMQAGITPNAWQANDEFLTSGEGHMWHVRVVSSDDDLNWCDFEVRAKDAEEAATKAETVARSHPEYYFETGIQPTYHAMRHDIEPLEDPDDFDDSEDQFAGADAPFPGQEA